MLWCKEQDDVAGILMPDISSQRMFYNIPTVEYFAAANEQGNAADCLVIGRYSFSKLAFAKASKILLESAAENHRYLVVDEVGKLELMGQGFNHVVAELISTEQERKTNLLLVIRDTLVERVTKHFGIKYYKQVQLLKEL